MPKIKRKISKRDRRKFVDDWLEEHSLTRATLQSKAHIDGLGELGEMDFYKIAWGHRRKYD
ncbi:MAG: hypothetical protein KAS32_21120 [Candidatus Peribacteraceae bacterium]|nr:hypothetical protein [Candidatus Peribacteraceae bacterium]